MVALEEAMGAATVLQGTYQETLAVSTQAHAEPALNGTRDKALDVAKGIAICLVLLGHTTPIAFVPGSVPNLTSHLSSLVVNAPYRWVYMTAVPTFYLVSSMLYVRRWNGTRAFLWRRLKLTGVLIGMWMLVQYVWYAVMMRQLPSITLADFRVGGPMPPGAGVPVYYFLVDLLLLYFVMDAVCRMRAAIGDAVAERVSLVVVAGFVTAFGLLPFFGVTMIPIWSLWPFICYPFLALVVGSEEIHDRGLLLACGALFVLGMGADVAWRTASVDVTQLGYARIPLVAGSVLALFLATALASRTTRVSKGLATLGLFSLGLYVIHPFVMTLLSGFAPVRSFDWPGGELTLRLEYAAAVFALTLVTVLLLARTPLRMLVTSERVSTPRS